MNAPPITFSWNVNLGHVVSLLTILLVGVTGYVNLQRDVADHDKRIAVVEAVIAGHSQRLAAKDVADSRLAANFEALDRLMQEVRNELRSINRRADP